MNFDRPYPDHIFTAVIWEETRPKFRYRPESLQGRSVCVTGIIDTYKGRPQIIVSDPSQLSVAEAEQ